MNFHFAPVQGHTDAAYRHFHSLIYGNLSDYYTPFIRLEHGGIRGRDAKDISSPLNDCNHFIPQIIFRDRDELHALVEILKAMGKKEVDLNMGCPFPLQTGHGRGAATISNKELAKAVCDTITSNPGMRFSVKMRLGFNEPDEWRNLLECLNNVELSHIAVHPRVAKQQYVGDLYLDRMEEIIKESKNPVVFNGEIKTPADIMEIIERFPGISGVMIGRGLLGRPSLVAEYKDGKEWSRQQRLATMLEFHQKLLHHYEEILCGDSQLISKIKPFWEYAEVEIGRKAWKAIKKATNIAKYHSAVALID